MNRSLPAAFQTGIAPYVVKYHVQTGEFETTTIDLWTVELIAADRGLYVDENNDLDLIEWVIPGGMSQAGEVACHTVIHDYLRLIRMQAAIFNGRAVSVEDLVAVRAAGVAIHFLTLAAQNHIARIADKDPVLNAVLTERGLADMQAHVAPNTNGHVVDEQGQQIPDAVPTVMCGIHAVDEDRCGCYALIREAEAIVSGVSH